jgi:nucleoside-diphosphate-sugar epimerase
MKTKIKVVTQDDRKRPENSEVFRLLSNNSQAKDLLGWAPEISLEDGLSKTIDWLKTNHHLYERAKTSYVV